MKSNVDNRLMEHAKHTIKTYSSSERRGLRWAAALAKQIWHAPRTIKRFLSDQNYRSIFFMQLFNASNVHQTTSTTLMNRYPDIFSECRQYFHNHSQLKILSFGCSTGEEVLTLRHYFPHAQIIGADVNKRSLKLCRKLPVDDQIRFIYSSSDELKKHGPFDIIFCMAVLQRTPHKIAASGITNLNDIYPFHKFEHQVMELDQLTKPQGLLVIHYSQYSLLDTRIASKYKPFGHANQDDYVSPVFDRNGNMKNNPASQNSIFLKTEI